MRFREFQAEVRTLIAEGCSSLGWSGFDPEVGLPPNPSYGDLSSPIALRIAKTTGSKPADVALKLASKIAPETEKTKYVASVSAHPGGYLNFTIMFPRFILDVVAESTASSEVGTYPPTGKSYAVEHTNVNPNKALHIGHARNLVLGDSLVRVLRHMGHKVQALNYVDDSGAQVADIVVGFKFLGMSDTPPPGTRFDSYCGDNVYTKVTQEYGKNPSLKEKQAFVLKEIERGTGEFAEYAKSVVDRILSDQLATCWRMGASYDLLNWESQIVHSGMWEGVFEVLKQNGYVKFETEGDNKGCWVIPDPDTGEQKVVVRSDGTVVYVAKDIPYAAWKLGLIEDPFGYEAYAVSQPGGRRLYSTTLKGDKSGASFGSADIAVSVIDTRQSYLQRIVGKVLESMGEGASKRYLHRAYEVVALSKKTGLQLGFEVEGEFTHMSGRKGLYVNVDAMLAAMKDKARIETRKRNLSESEGWVEDVAEAIAVSALRYELLKQDPDKMIVFDMETSLRFEGDTGPYLLYTYARAKRILGKTEGTPNISPDSSARLRRSQETALAKRMSMLDMSLSTAAEYLSPKEVARFAHDLAAAFNDFYENVPVNQEEDPAIRDARLALVDAASRVMSQAMRLMGIPVKEKI